MHSASCARLLAVGPSGADTRRNLFCTLLDLAPTASAQKTSGTITGTVADPSGGRRSGATVGLVSERTGAARQTVSNEQGSFSFPELDPGVYTLT